MALPTRDEVLQLAVLSSIRTGNNFPVMYNSLVEAIKNDSCEANVETSAPECKTALIRAVEHLQIKYIPLFLDAGARLDHESSNGETVSGLLVYICRLYWY